jgi:SprT protein
MQSRLATIVSRVQEVCAKAVRLYGVNLDDLDVRLDLKGKAAGKAGYCVKSYYIRLNVDMIQNDSFTHIIKDTIPHEIAHIVCCMNPMLGKGHNNGWKRVCMALGGNGSTTHSEPVTPARKMRKFQYITTSGRAVVVSSKRHQLVQQGKQYVFTQDGSKINRHCVYAEVAG